MLKKVTFVNSIDDLKNFSIELSKLLNVNHFLLLHGQIGVGKTTLVRMICQQLNSSDNVSSPTFDILKRYWSKKLQIYINHFDFFRTKVNDETTLLLFEDLIINALNIIEWPQNVPSVLWKESQLVTNLLIKIAPNGERIIKII